MSIFILYITLGKEKMVIYSNTVLMFCKVLKTHDIHSPRNSEKKPVGRNINTLHGWWRAQNMAVACQETRQWDRDHWAEIWIRNFKFMFLTHVLHVCYMLRPKYSSAQGHKLCLLSLLPPTLVDQWLFLLIELGGGGVAVSKRCISPFRNFNVLQDLMTLRHLIHLLRPELKWG